MTAATSTHILLDASGVAWIGETNVKVIEVVLDKLIHGYSAEEIHLQHPDLSLAQIHSALAYYFDHSAELESQIESRYRYAEDLRSNSAPPFTREELLRRLGQS